jgi:hypothetical protein
METKEIIEEIKNIQFDYDDPSWEELPFLDDESFAKLEEVKSETTNPRRDYVGTKTYIKNNHDGKYFFIEIYGNDMGYEIYDYGEVRPIEKTIITYEKI